MSHTYTHTSTHKQTRGNPLKRNLMPVWLYSIYSADIPGGPRNVNQVSRHRGTGEVSWHQTKWFRLDLSSAKSPPPPFHSLRLYHKWEVTDKFQTWGTLSTSSQLHYKLPNLLEALCLLMFHYGSLKQARYEMLSPHC